MEFYTENGFLPTESLTSRGLPKLCSTLPSSLPHNIFKDKEKNVLAFNPSERPVGGSSTIQRIKDSYFRDPPDNNFQSTCLKNNKATLSTKTDTLNRHSNKNQNHNNKNNKTEFQTVLTVAEDPQGEEILKRDVRGLSVDRIKMVNKRILPKRSNLISANIRPTIY